MNRVNLSEKIENILYEVLYLEWNKIIDYK